jgi:hypothetical protein
VVIDVLASIERSPLATWTRESVSIWAYPTILTLHTIGLSILVGASVVVDLRLLGFAKRMPPSSLRPLFPMMWWAFALNAVTGVLLFMADATRKAAQPIFYIKLTLIGLALWNLTIARRALLHDPELTPSEMSSRIRRIAVVSLVLWTGTITAGRLMAYF